MKPNKISDQGFYKEYRVDGVPTALAVVAEELATRLDFQHSFLDLFTCCFTPTPKQAEVFKWYLSRPPGLYELLLYGSVGSAKTWASLSLITYIMLRYSGVTGLAVRNTYPELEDFLAPTIEKMWNLFDIPYRVVRKPHPTYYLPNGSVLMCRSASRASGAGQEKADTLGSSELAFAYLNEGDNIAQQYYTTLFARTRQRGQMSRPLLIIDCNPPSTDNWIYDHFFIRNCGTSEDSTVRAWKFSMELNTYLPDKDNYIKDMKAKYGQHPALYKKFVLGDFGPTVKGKAIFGGIYSDTLHVPEKGRVVWDHTQPLLRGWDFGYGHPAVVICQYLPDYNRFNALRATIGRETLLLPYARHILDICETYWPGASWEDFCDPAGSYKKSTGKTDVETLIELGLKPRYTKGVSVSYGLDLIRQCLVELSDYDHRPIMQLDNYGAAVIGEALSFGYTVDPDAKASKKELQPYKDGYYEHVMDALRYIIIHKIKLFGKARGKIPNITKANWIKHEGKSVASRLYTVNDLSSSLGKLRTNGFGAF